MTSIMANTRVAKGMLGTGLDSARRDLGVRSAAPVRGRPSAYEGGRHEAEQRAPAPLDRGLHPQLRDHEARRGPRDDRQAARLRVERVSAAEADPPRAVRQGAV